MEANDQLIQEIVDLVAKQPWAPLKVLQKNPKYKHLNAYILEWTRHLPDILYCARIYYTIHKIRDYVKCATPECNNDIPHNTKFKPLIGPGTTHCCSRCAQLDPKTKEKSEQTSFQKCGYRKPQQSPEYKKKLSEKLQNMPQSHWDNALQKRVVTCRDLYGVDSVSQVKEFKDKAAQTFKNRPEEVKKAQFEHAQQVKIEKYGDAGHGKKISQTRKSFSKERNAQINETRKHTVLRDYGVEYVSQSRECKEKISKTKRSSYYDDAILSNPDVIPLFTKEEFVAHLSDELM